MNCFLVLLLLVLILAINSVHAQNHNDEGDTQARTRERDLEYQTYLNSLSKVALVKMLEDYGIDIEDDSYSKEELVQYVQIMFREIEKKGLELPAAYRPKQKEQQQQHSKDDVGTHKTTVVSPAPNAANASVWELVKAQVQSDLAPFLVLLPKPLKMFVQNQAVALWSTLKVSIRGAAGPMLQTAARVIRWAGNWLIDISDRVVQHGQKVSKQHERAATARVK